MTGKTPNGTFLRLARLFVVLLGIVLAASHFGELHFTLDNLSNFPVHFAAAFFACAIALARLGDRRFALVSTIGMALSLWPVVPWYFPDSAGPATPGAGTVKVLVSNVYVHNRQHRRVLRLIDRERPDVVGLVEVNSRWLRKIAGLRATYPYHFEVPDEEFIGLALYSRLPLADARILHLGEAGAPAIAVTMTTPDGEVELILAHPTSPLDTEHVERRNAQLRALGRYVATQQLPVVVAGDLNAAMWNRNYRAFAEPAGLHNARAGTGVGPTWPSLWPLGVPIDHIVATPPVHFRNFRILESIGSDHLPVSAEFSLR